MWEWLATNWTMLVIALVALACPLTHFFRHSHDTGHPHQNRRPGTVKQQPAAAPPVSSGGLLAAPGARWCLRKMVRDAIIALGSVA